MLTSSSSSLLLVAAKTAPLYSFPRWLHERKTSLLQQVAARRLLLPFCESQQQKKQQTSELIHAIRQGIGRSHQSAKQENLENFLPKDHGRELRFELEVEIADVKYMNILRKEIFSKTTENSRRAHLRIFKKIVRNFTLLVDQLSRVMTPTSEGKLSMPLQGKMPRLPQARHGPPGKPVKR